MPHANRSKRRDNPARNPTPDEVRQAREERNLSPAEAAKPIFNTGSWWEDVESGKKRMHPALWQFWLLTVDDALLAALQSARQYVQTAQPFTTGYVAEQLATKTLDCIDHVEEILGK